MTQQTIATGVAHGVPVDLNTALRSDKTALEKWQSLTPLARNEWICWIISVSKPETRNRHTKRTVAELLKGNRRPCCWYGCVHRADKSASPSALRAALHQKAHRT